jgi:hypothetical protein
MIIRREVFKAVIPAVDPDDKRWALGHVQIQPDGAAVATNGHVLLIARDRHQRKDEDFPAKGLPEFKGNPEQPVLIPKAAIDKLIAGMPKKTPLEILTCAQLTTNGDGAPVISTTDLEVPCTVHLKAGADAPSYPEYQRVIPREDRPSLHVSWSVEVLETLIKSMKAIAEKHAIGGGVITFSLPIEPQHQGAKRPGTSYEEFPDEVNEDGACQHCSQQKHAHYHRDADDQAPLCQVPDGTIIDTVAVSMRGNGIEVQGVIMPVKPADR